MGGGRGVHRPYKDRPSRINPRKRGFGRNAHQAATREVEQWLRRGAFGLGPSVGSIGWLDMGGELALLTEHPSYNRLCARRDRGS